MSLELIATSALQIADDEGLDALTIKRVSDALGVGTMTLYGYVRTKEEILAAMTEVAVAQMKLPSEGSWEKQIVALFTEMHSMLLRHPSVSLLNARQPLLVGPATLAVIERALEVVVASGLDGAEAVRAFRSLMSFTLGSALFYVARRGDLGEAALRERAATLHAAESDRFPAIVALAGYLSDEATADHFHRGLLNLVAGIRSDVCD